MALSDKRARRAIIQSISEHGRISKMAALRLCASLSQLERISSGKCGIIEMHGFYTTQEEIEDKADFKRSTLLCGHDTNGTGGIHALRGT
jgi:hypothetical protein